VTPAEVPEAYLSRIRAGDADGLRAMFAADAIFRGPAGLLRGRDAIHAFYVGVFSKRRPQMSVGRTVIEGSTVVFELIDRDGGRPPEDPTTALDLMELNDAGEIASFTVFHRQQVAPG
jgi:hypothetical protein